MWMIPVMRKQGKNPCVAVTRDERWGRSYESYGESPELQEILTANYVEGLQQQGIIACAKHFLGDGGTEWLTGEKVTVDRGNITEIDIVTLKNIHAQGYIEAIKARVGTVMASFSSFQNKHMHGHKQLLSDYLKGPETKGGLNFKGFVCGDWDGMSELYEISPKYKDRVIASFNAGIDMAMEQDKWKTVINILKEGTQSGAISMDRIDDAVSRILTVKFRFNLFDNPITDNITEIGTPENREIAAQAVHESLVLLKNKDDILPLKKKSKIFVTGPLSDHIGAQCGGWTVKWQGISNHEKTLFHGATSILDGIRSILNENGGQCIVDAKKAGSADAAVVVVGELPYSEWMGDIKIEGTMRLDDIGSNCSPENRKALNNARDLGIPVIVIIISGRPLIITDEIKKWDACIAAWLPGSEGAAVADLLFGNLNFKGTLPVTWPKSIRQLPINVDDPRYEKTGKKPLFPYGFGLKMKL
jgi:beta-glucosidase